MKKLICFILLAGMLFSTLMAAGCAPAASGDPENTTGSDETTAAEEKDPQPLELFVSTDGKEDGKGTKDEPFATIENARDYIRTLNKADYTSITVNVAEGVYRTSGITFDSSDSGTENCRITYKANGNVTLTGGMVLDPSAFAKVTDEEMLSRLSDDAKENVYCVDLNSLGITAEQVGKLYTIGTFNTARFYDGDYLGDMYCELFCNDARMNLARYPDTGFAETPDVQPGDYGDTPGYKEPNPKGDTYFLDDELNARIASWKTLDDVWMFGYFGLDWADGSTLIEKFDPEAKTLTTKFVSQYEALKGNPYYFFNVFEELDAPGEWYLDRNTMMLYMYPTSEIGSANIELTLSKDKIIVMNSVSFMTLDGFSISGTRGDAMYVTGNNNVFNNCTIRNVGGWAMYLNGTDNLVSRCEITRTGRGGVQLNGGDVTTLTSGNNIVENCFIHDWSEIWRTYQGGVSIGGVGNIIRHNEFCNSPHTAIHFGGNNNVIEYNNIHHVCLNSNDAGAIYGGRSWWNAYGTKIRYNFVHNLDSTDTAPQGIYLDDALSGITVHGNILANIKGIGVLIGSGRDNTMTNNVLIDCGAYYDDRAFRGCKFVDEWFEVARIDGEMWKSLLASPWQSDIWKEAFPELAKCHHDDDNMEDYYYVAQAIGVIRNNIFILPANRENHWDCFDFGFSVYENNMEYTPNFKKQLFTDWRQEDFTFIENPIILQDNPEFELIDITQMGIIGESADEE